MEEPVSLVIGCVHGYGYHEVEPWIVSLKKSGYSGKVALLVFSGSKSFLNKLVEQGIYALVYKRNDDGSVGYPDGVRPEQMMVLRFSYMLHELTNNPYFKDVEYVITTDVKDVVFQENPECKALEFSGLIVNREGFKYEDEPWSKYNMQSAYGEAVYNSIKNLPVTCAGVMAGDIDTIKGLFQQIVLISAASRFGINQVPGGGGPDQAALNIILNSRPWWSVTYCDRKILHAGTSIPGIEAGNGVIGLDVRRNPEKLEQYKRLFSLKSYPVIKDGLFINKFDGSPYSIIHQYDRIPAWKELVDKKYRGQDADIQ